MCQYSFILDPCVSIQPFREVSPHDINQNIKPAAKPRSTTICVNCKELSWKYIFKNVKFFWLSQLKRFPIPALSSADGAGPSTLTRAGCSWAAAAGTRVLMNTGWSSAPASWRPTGARWGQVSPCAPIVAGNNFSIQATILTFISGRCKSVSLSPDCDFSSISAVKRWLRGSWWTVACSQTEDKQKPG